MKKTLELVIDAKAELGEGPFWDEEKNKLLWIDGYAGRIYIYNQQTGSNRYIDVGQYIGCINLRQKKGAVLALQHGLYFLDLESSALSKITDPEEEKANNRLNDGKCDCNGRLWVGSMNMEGHHRSENLDPTGALYYMDKDLKTEKKLDNITISNGLAWSKDNKTMYYIDTPTRKVVAYDFNKYKGQISNERTVVKIPKDQGIPDGMTIDDNDNLWIAHFGGYQVSCWDPRTGEKVDKIEMPVKNVTCCTFGGENLDELFITTARAGLSKDELSKQPKAGGLFKIKPGIKGLPPYKFNG